MTERRASLAVRLTALFAAGTLLIVIGNAVFTLLFLKDSIEKELEEILDRETTEVDFGIEDSTRTKDAFEELFLKRLAGRGDLELAWRLWNGDDGTEVSTSGRALLFETAKPPATPTNEIGRSGELRWRTTKLRTGYVLTVIVDGASRFKLLGEYERLALKRTVFSVGFAALISWLFMRRVSGYLQGVADNLRAESTGLPQLAFANSPREIAAIADALRERLDRVRKASEQAQLFTASLAHELRSPIQNLVGETEVALIAPRDAATYRAVLQSNLHELRELGDAVDNLMTICAQRGTDSKILREEFDLGDEAEIRIARERSRGRLLDVGLDIHRSGDTRIVGDREALMRALRNLAGNAIDFSPPGTTVEVHIAGEQDQIRIRVDDSGPGVPADIRDRIFEPFFSGPAKRGGRVGYGLGLAIARTAVVAQGGSIEVVDNPGGGASFRIELPRRPARPNAVT
ncbi:MAG: HAMP domain-containing histidine kinase [Planctomycetes bacterium]|nr:HAMP domain-containing histidine kinase [Planctomycetota bacterium]